jgi:hypothetical protein
MASPRPNWPAGLPSPLALQAATEAIRRQYVLPATMLHPAVARQALELGYLMSAYGLVPAEAQPAAVQSDIVVDTPRKPMRPAGIRGRRRPGRRALIVDAVAETVT